jgi:(2Fe-2S) ferredoxin
MTETSTDDPDTAARIVDEHLVQNRPLGPHR